MKKILINSNPWQTRAALMDEEQLQDVYFDSDSDVDLERCFFRGTISKIIPGLQTAFVEIGQEKAGFLHISEVDRVLAANRIAKSQQLEGINEEYTSKTVKKVMDISKVFKEKEDVLVQVIKEPVYEKGAKLTTCFTLPGKFIVLMPNIPQVGISKKIDDRDERNRLKDILQSCLPDGMGAIVRTTSLYRDARDIKKDVGFLVSLWSSIQKKFASSKSEELLFTDLPLSLRMVREHLTEEVDEIIVDSKEEINALEKYIDNLMPEHSKKLRLHTSDETLFTKFKVDEQIQEALQRKVHLKSGGSIIIESTEAMTVIDVNTGRYTGSDNLEQTIFRTNLEAAEEVVTQLRLRNIGGLIVIDFIDMNQTSHKNKLSELLDKTLKEKDKYQSVMLKVSEFGLVQMTRKRSGKTLVQQLMRDCHCCGTLGFIKSYQTMCFEMFENFTQHLKREGLKGPYLLKLSPDIFDFVVSVAYKGVLALEKELETRIVLESDENLDGIAFTVEKAQL